MGIELKTAFRIHESADVQITWLINVMKSREINITAEIHILSRVGIWVVQVYPTLLTSQTKMDIFPVNNTLSQIV